MQIETIDLRNINESDARTAAALVCTIWPKPGRTVEGLTAEMLTQWKSYSGPESQHPRSFLIREGGRLIAHATAVPRTIGTTAGDMTILALARVCTEPAARGRHLGEAVARAALELVDNGTFPFALFQTNESVRPFYERLGASQVTNRFINSTAADPAASAFWDPVIMRYPATAGWPHGEIDLKGRGW